MTRGVVQHLLAFFDAVLAKRMFHDKLRDIFNATVKYFRAAHIVSASRQVPQLIEKGIEAKMAEHLFNLTEDDGIS